MCWWQAIKNYYTTLGEKYSVAFIFNAVNFYLILNGKNIPWRVYAIVGFTLLISIYVTVKKIKRIQQEYRKNKTPEVFKTSGVETIPSAATAAIVEIGAF